MIATARPRGGHPIVNDRPQRTAQDAERGQAALEAARRDIVGCRSRMRLPIAMGEV